MFDSHQDFERLIAETAADARALGAKEVLEQIDLVRNALADNSPAAALAYSTARMVQASEAAHRDSHLQDMQRGRRVLQAARSGHRAVHGTKEQRQRLYDKYQRSVDLKYKANPRLSWFRLSNLVAQEHGCSYKTIQRNTNDPRA